MAKIEFEAAVKKAASYRSSGAGNRQILDKMQDGDTLQGIVSYHDERKGKDASGEEFLTIRAFLTTDKGMTDFRIPNPVTQLPTLKVGTSVELERTSFKNDKDEIVPMWRFNGILESAAKSTRAPKAEKTEKAK